MLFNVDSVTPPQSSRSSPSSCYIITIYSIKLTFSHTKFWLPGILSTLHWGLVTFWWFHPCFLLMSTTNSLVLLTFRKRIFLRHQLSNFFCQVGLLIVANDQSLHHSVVSKFDNDCEVGGGNTVICTVSTAGGSTHNPGVLRVKDAEMCRPICTACSLPVRKLEIHLQRDVLSPGSSSLVLSVERTMVLNAELKLAFKHNSIV